MAGQVLITEAPSAGIIGHGNTWERLVAEVEQPAGAYLMVGPAGVGKSLVARRFAQRLVCHQSGHHVEGCTACRLVREDAHPDVVVVSPVQRQRIGVDDARRVVSAAVRTPVEAERKVFLIDREMTEAAANVLLKTLGESVGSTVFLLVTISTEDFPPTVASRCRIVHFGKVSTDEIIEGLTERGVAPSEARAIAEVAGGRPGMALRLKGEKAAARFRTAWLKQAAQLADRDGLGAGEALAMVDEILIYGERMLDQVRPPKKASKEDKDRALRETRRQRRLLWVLGLEIMAAWYVDAAARVMGGSPRPLGAQVPPNRLDAARALRSADLILEAGAEMAVINLRPRTRLAELFCRITAP